jgi:hypothetical protein
MKARPHIGLLRSTPLFIATGGIADGVNDQTPGMPAGNQQNDLLILFVESLGSDPIPATPAGYTLLGTQVGGGSLVRLTIFYKIEGAAEVAPTVVDTGDHQATALIAIRGASTGTPIEASAFGTQAAGSTTTTIPGVTTLGLDRMIVFCVAIDNSAAAGTAFSSGYTNANLTSLTEIFDHRHTSGADGGFAGFYGFKATAGAIGSTTATQVSDERCFVAMAVRGFGP